MERSHYRKRYSTSRRRQPSRGRSAGQPVRQKDIREGILTQCIICGAALAVILFCNVINTNFAKSTRNSINAVLSENMTADDIKGAFDRAVASITDIRESVSVMFGGSPQSRAGATDVFVQVSAPPQSTDNTNNLIHTPNTSSLIPTSSSDLRIDEDILEEINNRKDYYGVLQSKK